MANYIVSYDLNGKVPTHKEMDDHMEKAGWTRARILETVWYVGTPQKRKEVSKYVMKILSKNDRLLTVRAGGGSAYNLLVDVKSLSEAWTDNAS